MLWNDKLKLLIDSQQLTPSKLGKLTNISVNTIKSWLVSRESAKFRTLSQRDFNYIQSVVLMNQVSSDQDREHLISDNTFSVEYHLKNGLECLTEHLNNAGSMDSREVKNILENFNCAYQDICLANELIREYFLAIKTHRLQQKNKDNEPREQARVHLENQ
ncbi:hypothetical protein Lqui_2435 [Legionella quinlivanii]|uniref:Uncharacterized protein n=1 Tax=Legionella quinlivanii TaxID=45073 RepID=A0A0W0XSA8_9GAMM|nr:hypothetical protein [Legionella quinlivanii]KTD47509.1 hypothetical protein Lqui_2435 [Legionella quinlivanii]STY49803.1 Uncharacterised protein [Legionella quinlivanii]